MPNETRTFDKVYHDIKRSKSLTPFLKLLIHHIYSYNDTDYGCCQTNARIAEENGMSIRQVSYSLQRLADAKMLISKQREGRTAQLYIDMDRVLFLVSTEHLQQDEQDELKRQPNLSLTKGEPKQEAIAAPPAPSVTIPSTPVMSNITIDDIRFEVEQQAIDIGVHPKHKECADICVTYLNRLRKNETIMNVKQEIKEALFKAFPNNKALAEQPAAKHCG